MRPRFLRSAAALLAGGALGLSLIAAPSASAETVSVVATADTFVNAAAPSTPQGSSTSLAAYGTPVVITYLRFPVPATPAGEEVASASLSIRTTASATAGSPNDQVVRLAGDGWTEGALTYPSRPTLGAVVGTLTSATASSTTYEVDLDAAAIAAAAGTNLTLAVTGTGSDSFWISSREATPASVRPTLSVEHEATGPADTEPPSTPAALAADVDGSSVDLSWTASTDNIGVVGYEVHRSATSGFTPSAATVVATPTSTSSSESRPAGTWYYRVIALDAAGNASAASSEVSAVVEDEPVEPVGPPVTVTAVADTFVNAAAPSTPQGSSTSLAAYGSPVVTSYLRFEVPSTPSGQQVASATLEVRTTASATSGSANDQVVRLAGNDWAESSMTYPTRPSLGAEVGTLSSATASSTSYDVDLDTAAIEAAAGTPVTLAVTGSGGDSFWFSSREANPASVRPQLTVAHELSGPADTEAPGTPTDLAATVDGTTVDLAWTASTDNVGVAGYEVHRSTTSGFTASPANVVASTATPSWTETRTPGTWYYRVVALDAAENASDASAEASAVVEEEPVDPVGPPVTVTAVADTFVNASAPSTTQGSSTSLASYGSPVVISYLRFPVPANPSGQVVDTATLTIRTTSVASAGSVNDQIVRVSGDGWNEASLTYPSRPTPGAQVGTIPAPNSASTAFTVAVDADAINAAAGSTLTLAVTGTGSDSFWFTSREAAAADTRPQLTVQRGLAGPPVEESVVMAAGDLACPPGSAVTAVTCRHDEVGDLTAAASPDQFIAVGDLQNDYARLSDFLGANGYDSAFASLRPITLPVIGNHEMLDPSGPTRGYFDYLYGPGVNEGAFGTRPNGYYSSTIGSWKFIALNSECAPDAPNGATMVAGGCDVGSPQYQWLQQELASSPQCTVVAFHRPRWTTGAAHAPYAPLAPMWDLMAQEGVDVTLSGHMHLTEHFKPIGVSGTGNPVLDPEGIRSFVVPGGQNLRTFGTSSGPMFNALEARSNTAFGPLELKLRDGEYSWDMKAISGMTVNNVSTNGSFAGSGTCH